MIERDAAGNVIYFRSAKGSKRHADYSCVNGRRAIRSGDPLRIPAEQVKDWAPCRFCCNVEELAAAPVAPVAPVAEKPEDAMCPNTGVARPGSRRLRDTCADCGKEGAVNPKTGTLRAHKPVIQWAEENGEPTGTIGGRRIKITGAEGNYSVLTNRGGDASLTMVATGIPTIRKARVWANVKYGM